ncbi:DNA-binding CsgD family transcriptional regulator [Streptomyces olivoverticillatus]|uniref:DNA-binding CsgD family transcriptional regulator n=1 Tax=Streptomyces olivoverticillatus TaxID=66427 RepID=A0A7W7LL82_9ACTN|nr:LuxR family transcriptional regulator [Streptomyces olivoverticillatus]MBB4892314.1 DNA-binding CsgD family transcriptional regulator [Streptomyces olivoverticillatus]
MVFTDRENEFAMLESALADFRAGNARVVLVEGAVGCGKSELADTVAERAAGSGALVLRAIGTEAERELPLGVLGQLAAAAPPGTLPPVTPETGDGAAARIEAMQAFCAAVHRLGTTTPVVICVDDLHLVDDLSSRYLLHLARRTRRARVLLLLTETVHERSDDPVLGTELLRNPHFTRLRLEPLGPAAVAAVLARGGAAADDEELVAQLHHASGGNPLLLRALVDDRRGPGLAFPQAVLACLYRCGQTTTELAGALAVLDGHATAERAAELTGIPTATAARTIAALNSAGLLDGTAFRHPAARLAVLDRIPDEEAAALHRRAAALAHRAGAPATEVADHLLAAHHVAEDWAVATLRAAADRLLADGAAERATACLQLAHAGSADDTEKTILRTALAAAAWRDDPAAAERHLDAPLATLRTRRLPAAATAPLARLLVAQGRIDEATEVLEHHAASGEAPQPTGWDTLRDAPLDGLSAFPQWSGRAAVPDEPAAKQHAGRRPATRPGAAAAGTAPAEALRGRAFNAQHRTPSWPGEAARRTERPAPSPAVFWAVPEYERDGSAGEAAELFLRGTTLADATLAPIVQALRTLLHTDGPLRAVSWCQAFMDEAARRGAPGWRAVFGALRAEALLRQGDLTGAEAQAAAVLEEVPQRGGSLFLTGVSATLIRARTAMGRHDEAARELSKPVPEGLSGSYHGLNFLRARGQYHLATHRFHAALGDFLDIGRTMRRWNLDRPLLLPWRAGAAEALLHLGEAHQASRFVADQLATRDAGHPWVSGISLRLRAATSEPKERQVLLARAVDDLRRSGDRCELARTMADLGQAFKELGEPGRANMVNRRAWHLAKECGADALRERILPGHAGAAAGAPDEAAPEAADRLDPDARLSESEKRVAMLAVHGHTNREIASKLYITVSTVEQHLTRVYRKLKITRRQELPVDLQLIGSQEIAWT